MPEEIEVDTDKLHEAIQEEVEKEGGTLLRTIALTTALFAALAAVSSLLAGSTVNEALALKTEATQLQAQASDQWAYYQAKGIKAVVLEVPERSVGQRGQIGFCQTLDKDLCALQGRAAGSAEKGPGVRAQRDEKGSDADLLIHRHHFFAYTVAMLQVAIALGAVAALTRKRSPGSGRHRLALSALASSCGQCS